jgi:hypothetical protein
MHNEVVHLREDATELLRRGGLAQPVAVSVNSSDGSCWVAARGNWDYLLNAYVSSEVIHLAANGAVLWRGPFFAASTLAADPVDGSCWVGEAQGWAGEPPVWRTAAVTHLAEDGTELWRRTDFANIGRVAVDPVDGSCWVADQYPNNEVLHLAADGRELSRTGGFDGPASVSPDPSDGSCWLADIQHHQIVHLGVYGATGPFADIPARSWARRQIEACVRAGIVSGYPDATYQPEAPVDRAAMAVYLARGLAGGDARVPPGPITASFADVPAQHWAYRYVEYAKARGVVEGYPRGLYGPDEKVDRGQMAVFLARAVEAATDGRSLKYYGPPEIPTFPDVTPLNAWAWCYKHVEYLADPERMVVRGYPDGLYHPELVCTRDQMAVYVTRAFGLL